MSSHVLTLVAGIKQAVPGGKFIKVISAAFNLDVHFYRLDGRQYAIADNVSQGDAFNEPDGFGYAEIVSDTAQSIEVQVLPVMMSSNSIVGNVTALTRFDNLSADGNRYAGGFQANATVGKVSYIGLHNASITHDLWCTASKFAAPAGQFLFGLMDYTDIAGWVNFTSAGNLSHSKTGGANGVGVIVRNTLTATGHPSAYGYVPADTAGSMSPFDYKNAPVKIEPGKVLAISGVGANETVTGFFEWYEDLIS